ncbi:MAG TPA: hypothetical protein VED24_03320 [Candidatus Acidoferrum sp.]|nr:hypothetical protein [Candidatus Acidoferrum sp.]
MRRVVAAFNRSGLRYALTGAIAASYYGRPRTTLDVDVLVVTKESELARLAKSLTEEGIKVGTRELSRALRSKYRIATLLDSKSPHRLDIIFTDERLDRKAGPILGAHTYYQTAESLILSKLRMIKATLQPERVATDRQDIKAILEAAHVNLLSIRRRARSQGTLQLLDELTSD